MALRLGLGHLRLGGRRGIGITDLIAPVVTNADLAVSVFTVSLSEPGTGFYVWRTSTTPVAGSVAKAEALAASPPQTLTLVAGANTGTLTGLPTASGNWYPHLVGQDATGNLGALTVASANPEVVLSVWDPDLLTITAVTLAPGDTSPSGIHFKADGTKLWISCDNANTIREFSVSPAWDISTAAFVSAFAVGTQDTSPTDVVVSTDGTKLFVIGNQNDTVYMYTMSTPFLLSSASAAPTSTFVLGVETLTGLQFSDDGTKFYTSGSASDDIRQYNMSVAWDITTAVQGTSLSVGGPVEGAMSGLCFGDSGNRLYIVGSGQVKIKMYNLSTPWVVSTGVISIKEKLISGETLLPTGIFWKPTGDVLFMVDDTNNLIKRYIT